MARGGSVPKQKSCQINRSTFNKWVHSSTPQAKTIAPLIVRFSHPSSSNTHWHTRTHTKAPWHKQTGSDRDCCCTRGGPMCEVARRPGDVRAVIHSRKYAKTCCCSIFFVWIFHCPARLWLGGKRSRDFLPDRATSNAESARHGARPVPNLRQVCRRPPPARPAADSGRKDPRPGKKRSSMCKKSAFDTYTC